MKVSLAIISFLTLFSCITCQNKKEKAENNANHQSITSEKLKSIVKEKKYTIINFWVNWCHFSRDGLQEFYGNYPLMNNDSIQAYLVVMSDTSAANHYLSSNNIRLGYFFYKTDSYDKGWRSLKDNMNKKTLLKEAFDYSAEEGFPCVLLIDSTNSVLCDCGQSKWALNMINHISMPD